ncbi:MAG TPA: hypothetical protein VLS49_00050 [Usitatibacter sp.]|nr:hypothetical protein [Usitatibacter sp.]
MPATNDRRNPGKPINNRELADDLCAASIALREVRRRHVKSYGTLIPHVFMGDVLARIGCCLGDGIAAVASDSDAEIAAILEALERGMSAGDRETRNVISLSFVADGELESFFARLRPRLGPRIGAQVRGR